MNTLLLKEFEIDEVTDFAQYLSDYGVDHSDIFSVSGRADTLKGNLIIYLVDGAVIEATWKTCQFQPDSTLFTGDEPFKFIYDGTLMDFSELPLGVCIARAIEYKKAKEFVRVFDDLRQS